MTEKDIVDAYARIRTNDNTIPDEVLDYMFATAIKTFRAKQDVQLSHSAPTANAVTEYITLRCKGNVPHDIGLEIVKLIDLLEIKTPNAC